MVSRLLVWDFENAHRDDVKVVDHHVELTRVALGLVLPREGLEGQMVQFESQVSSDHLEARLVEDFCGLPQTFRAIDCLALCQVHFGVKSFCLLFESQQDRVLFVDYFDVTGRVLGSTSLRV